MQLLCAQLLLGLQAQQLLGLINRNFPSATATATTATSATTATAAAAAAAAATADTAAVAAIGYLANRRAGLLVGP